MNKDIHIVEMKPRKASRTLAKRSKRPLGRKKPRKTKIALFREFGVPDGAYRRYSGLKGVYWYFFSKFIRERDYREHGGLCMTCLQYVEKGQDQCGHLFAAKDCGWTLLFHPMNNHLQHAKCNNPRFTPSAGIYNAKNIEERYGKGTLDMLMELKKQKAKEWSASEYREKIKQISQRI